MSYNPLHDRDAGRRWGSRFLAYTTVKYNYNFIFTLVDLLFSLMQSLSLSMLQNKNILDNETVAENIGVFIWKFKTAFLLSDFRHPHYFKILCKYLWHPLLSALPITLYTNTLDDMTWYNKNEAEHLAIAVFTYKPVAHKCGTCL